MIQEILTYIILLIAIIFVLVNLYKAIFPKQNGCSGNCNCDAKKIREELLKNYSVSSPK
jgi:hypothetical protein